MFENVIVVVFYVENNKKIFLIFKIKIIKKHKKLILNKNFQILTYSI
jgi:hypothetical protein